VIRLECRNKGTGGKPPRSLTEKIHDSDREIEQIAGKDYPETELLQQVAGVGPLIALTFVPLRADPLGPSPQLFSRLHERLNGARRGDFVAVELALEIGTLIGVSLTLVAHHGELLPTLGGACWS
jgi:hypothetical protein